MKKALLVVLFLALGLAACSNSGTGNFRLYLTDFPVDGATALNVTFTEIWLYPADETEGVPVKIWPMSGETPMPINLLELVDGKKELIVSTQLKAGKYEQVRLVLDTTDGISTVTFPPESAAPGTFNIKVPSGEIKIPYEFELTDGNGVSMTLDFNVENSLQINDTGSPEKYILRPVVFVKEVTFGTGTV